MADKENTVKVAVRIRPLNDYEAVQDSSLCIDVVPGETQIRAGANAFYTFDHVFGADTTQQNIYQDCVSELLNAAFEGFNATILAYGQTGSGKTFTMGSAADDVISDEILGIIPRVIKNLFQIILQKEEQNCRSTYKVYVQFLEIYGEDIKDLLDQTKTSKVAIRETRSGEVFVTGAKEELVSSYEQMMKALEDGSKNRTTASTKMNQTSSRSHAIFTVNLEHIIHSEVVRDQLQVDSEALSESEVKEVDKIAVVTQEVQKCKFHFVDLAGSERAKRTGAQGQQLKEGIDINKGLLALGNVISALGDDQKKGKVFVPYRDSKLTRMLQDSLGGNSKTLMICCVSPAAVNYNESLNALRYANRARNIKNKPVVNRDPTVVMIDELRSSIMMLASELLEIKKRKQFVEINVNITEELLTNIVLGNSTGASVARSSLKPLEVPSPKLTSGSANSGKGASADIKKLKQTNEKLEQQYFEVKSRLTDADFETQRLTEQLKLARQSSSEISEQVYFAQSERDFFKMKWTEASPGEAHLLDSLSQSVNNTLSEAMAEHQIVEDKKEYTKVVVQYLREIDDLKRQLAIERSGNISKLENLHHTELTLPPEIDTEFTSAISSLISQTRTQLIEESRKLSTAINESIDDEDEFSEDKSTTQIVINDMEEEEKAFNKRQRLLNAEVADLGQSIQLKEQLMQQLIKSQQQYSVMKSFYEQKLSLLSVAMQEKQAERETLLAELSEISEKSNQTTVGQAREAKLREDLHLKDEELSKMKKKQEELRNLTQLQSQYSRQMAKLESDIVSMKKQRVDLSKTLQQEKKSYMVNLSEKAKEIERLKKDLFKASSEVKKLGRSKDIAESKAKDAIREGAALKKKTQELMKFHADVTSTQAARAAIRAISKASAKFADNKYLTDEEMRVKKWIDQRISEISAREAAADALKRQCEQQLELLQRKEALEKERIIAMSKATNHEVTDGDSAQGPSTPNAKSIVENSVTLPSTPIFSSSEEEKLLELIEDRLSSIDGQLNARNQKISDIRRQISEAGDISGSEKAVDVLKRTSGSLPAAHELIRLLFDMLIHVSKNFKIQSDQVNDLLEKERGHMQRIDDLQNKLAAEKRAYDMELTTINKEFEQKLQGFFHHISPPEIPHDMSVDSGDEADGGIKLSPLPPPPPHLSSSSSLSINSTAAVSFLSPSGRNPRNPFSFDAADIQLAIATEETKLLKTQLEREKMKTSNYEAKITELEKIKFTLMMDIEDKNFQIKFLEEDRELFKKMAEQLKAGLNSMGKDGKTVVLNATDRVSGSTTSTGLFGEYLHLSDDEEDTDSVLGEYDILGEEINRTGVVASAKSEASKGGNSHDDIFHRLNNPSNYTGHMRNIFKDDPASRRRRIQEQNRIPDPQKRHSGGSAHHQKKEKEHVPTPSAATAAASHHHYYSFSTTMAPWKKAVDGGGDEAADPSSLSIEVPEGDTPETSSPEPLPNVFSRLTKSMTGIHKHRDVITPRTTSPSSTNSSSLRLELNIETSRLPRSGSTGAGGIPTRAIPTTPLGPSSVRSSGSGSTLAHSPES